MDTAARTHERPHVALRAEVDQVLEIIATRVELSLAEAYLWGLRDGLKFGGMSNSEIESLASKRVPAVKGTVIGQEPAAQVLRHADIVEGWNAAERRKSQRRRSGQADLANSPLRRGWGERRTDWTAKEILDRES